MTCRCCVRALIDYSADPGCLRIDDSPIICHLSGNEGFCRSCEGNSLAGKFFDRTGLTEKAAVQLRGID